MNEKLVKNDQFKNWQMNPLKVNYLWMIMSFFHKPKLLNFNVITVVEMRSS